MTSCERQPGSKLSPAVNSFHRVEVDGPRCYLEPISTTPCAGTAGYRRDAFLCPLNLVYSTTWRRFAKP